jgi:hypothetical protein
MVAARKPQGHTTASVGSDLDFAMWAASSTGVSGSIHRLA